MYLTHEHHLNGVVVDDAALVVMLRIEHTMQRLEVMGDDEQRWLWIELKAPGKRNRMKSADANGNYWYQVITANYQDFHYMIIRNREGMYLDLRSARYIGGERKPDVWHGNVSKPLQKLEKYITALVDSICENPDAYNTHVEKNLPYSKRDGIIKRVDLNRICPTYRTFDNPKRVVDIVTKMNGLPIWSADKMTIITYMHIWRILYEAYRTKNRYEPISKSAFANKTDTDVFVRYNSKGSEIEGLDLDNEQGYQKWHDENSSYHCMDVAYARIHLYPRKKENRWGAEDVPVVVASGILHYHIVSIAIPMMWLICWRHCAMLELGWYAMSQPDCSVLLKRPTMLASLLEQTNTFMTRISEMKSGFLMCKMTSQLNKLLM